MTDSLIQIPMTGISAQSLNAEKGLVWDDALRVYRVMAPDLQDLEVWRAKPSSSLLWWRRLGMFVATAFVAAVLAAMAVITHTATQKNVGYESIDSRIRILQDQVTALSKPVMVKQEPSLPVISLPPATPTTYVANNTAAAPVAPTTIRVPERIRKPYTELTVALPAKPKQQPAVIPQSVPVAKMMRPTAPIASANSLPLAVVPPTTQQRSWPVSVEKNGIQFFDGKNTRLYKLGETLPNGEKIVDVDEGSATFATDKGVRQIRSSKLKESNSP